MQYETSNPYWNEIYVAVLDEGEIYNAGPKAQALSVSVLDKDHFGADDFIGGVTLTWDNILAQHCLPARWITLEASSTSSVQDVGKLLISVNVRNEHINGFEQIQVRQMLCIVENVAWGSFFVFHVLELF